MKPTAFPPIPIETKKAAWAVFGRSNFYLAVGDQANRLFDGLSLNGASIQSKMPMQTQAIHYLITIFQYIETLPDLQAADALRKRVDWKYALHLPLNFTDLEPAALCKFRRWLLGERIAQQNLQNLLSQIAVAIHFGSEYQFAWEADQVVLDVCQFNRLARIWETLNQAMEALATRYPDRLLAAARPHWYERYGSRHRNLDLRIDRQKRVELAQSIGADGKYLLELASDASSPLLVELNEIRALREVWREQYEIVDDKLVWRNNLCAGCSLTGIMTHFNNTDLRDP